MADEPIAPPLPSGSVDFDKIHAAARQNHDLEKAIADATFVHPDKVAADKAAAKAAEVQYADGTPVEDLKPIDPPATAPAKGKSKEA